MTIEPEESRDALAQMEERLRRSMQALGRLLAPLERAAQRTGTRFAFPDGATPEPRAASRRQRPPSTSSEESPNAGSQRRGQPPRPPGPFPSNTSAVQDPRLPAAARQSEPSGLQRRLVVVGAQELSQALGGRRDEVDRQRERDEVQRSIEENTRRMSESLERLEAESTARFA